MGSLFAKLPTSFFSTSKRLGSSSESHALLERTCLSREGRGCVDEAQLTLGAKMNIFSIPPFLGCAFSSRSNDKIHRTKVKV